MRIIGGEHKGFVFPGHKLQHTRPTTDRAKESLMNILHNRYEFEKCQVLDLYSGTGNIAFELWSRGSRFVHCVESHPKNVSYIGSVAQRLKAEPIIHKAKALAYLQRCTEEFDLIFADPPYGSTEHQQLIDTIFDRRLLREGGVFVMEHAAMTVIQDPRLSEQRTYGQSVFSLFVNLYL